MDNKELADLLQLVGMMNLQMEQMKKDLNEIQKKIKGDKKNV